MVVPTINHWDFIGISPAKICQDDPRCGFKQEQQSDLSKDPDRGRGVQIVGRLRVENPEWWVKL
jgi:hypothetical protein